MANNAFILGLAASIDDSAFLSTPDSFSLVGQNTGNLAFHHAIVKQLDITRASVSWWAPEEEVNRQSGVGIIPAANQLGPHVDLSGLGEKFSRISTPLVMIGLGAQSGIRQEIPEIPEGTLAWFREIVKRKPADGPSITVRGAFTLKVLEHYGLAEHAIALGCPSLFINPNPRLGRDIMERLRVPRRIAVAAGHQRWKHLSGVEAALAKLVTDTDGSYVVQAPIELVHAARNEVEILSEDTLEDFRTYACPHLSTQEFERWVAAYATVFFNIPAWMEHYRHFDLVVGTRIHGVMLALQAGIPGLCIVHDSRTLELCQTMKVPHVDFRDIKDGITLDHLAHLARFDPQEFDGNRSALAVSYISFLKNNGLSPSDDLLALGV